MLPLHVTRLQILVWKHCATLQGGTHSGGYGWYVFRRSCLVHIQAAMGGMYTGDHAWYTFGRLWVVHISMVNDICSLFFSLNCPSFLPRNEYLFSVLYSLLSVLTLFSLVDNYLITWLPDPLFIRGEDKQSPTLSRNEINQNFLYQLIYSCLNLSPKTLTKRTNVLQCTHAAKEEFFAVFCLYLARERPPSFTPLDLRPLTFDLHYLIQ